MPRMPSRALGSGWASVFSLTSRASDLSCPAAFENSGPIIRHGPHHGAQKSTTSGTSSTRDALARVAASTSMALPGMSGALQVPHFGPEPSFSSGTRFT